MMMSQVSKSDADNRTAIPCGDERLGTARGVVLMSDRQLRTRRRLHPCRDSSREPQESVSR